MRKFLLAAAAALLAVPAAAQQPPPPKLLVVISVDQFSANLFDEYRPQFTGGLARARVRDRCSATATRATPRPRPVPAIRPSSPAIIRRAPGSSATRGSTSRIAREDKTVYCAEDERVPAPRRPLQGLARATAGADARRTDEGALAREPQRRGLGQGPRGGDDERPQRRPALVLGRQGNSTTDLAGAPVPAGGAAR